MTKEKIIWWIIIIAMAVIVIWYYSKDTDYDKCIKENKGKQDGEECINCIPDGSKMANYKGIINGGECIKI